MDDFWGGVRRPGFQGCAPRNATRAGPPGIDQLSMGGPDGQYTGTYEFEQYKYVHEARKDSTLGEVGWRMSFTRKVGGRTARLYMQQVICENNPFNSKDENAICEKLDKDRPKVDPLVVGLDTSVCPYNLDDSGNIPSHENNMKKPYPPGCWEQDHGVKCNTDDPKCDQQCVAASKLWTCQDKGARNNNYKQHTYSCLGNQCDCEKERTVKGCSTCPSKIPDYGSGAAYKERLGLCSTKSDHCRKSRNACYGAVWPYLFKDEEELKTANDLKKDKATAWEAFIKYGPSHFWPESEKWVPCADKILHCDRHMKNGGCDDANERHDDWRRDCVKTCGYCNDPRYNPKKK